MLTVKYTDLFVVERDHAVRSDRVLNQWGNGVPIVYDKPTAESVARAIPGYHPKIIPVMVTIAERTDTSQAPVKSS